MNILLNENKKQQAIKFISLNSRNWGYIFELFKDEIFEMIELKVPKTIIVRYLSSELNADIKYTTFDSWLRKKKNQSSNTSKKDIQKQANEVKKETLRQNNSTSKEDRPWWEKEIERASKAMKEAALRL